MVYLSAVDDDTCHTIASAYSDVRNKQDKLNYAANGTFETVSDAQYKTQSAKNTKRMTNAQNKWDNDKTPLVGWTCK